MRALLLCCAAAAAAAAAPHTLQVAYNTSGPVSAFPFGSFSLTYDSVPLIAAGWPAVETFTWANGTRPPWDYIRRPLSRTFDLATATYTATYAWGSLAVAHARAGPLALDFLVTLTNGPASGAMSGGQFGVHGDEVYWAPNASDFTPPHAVTGLGYACAGCWPPTCGSAMVCDACHPQAIPIDWQSGAAAWVRVDAPAPAPRPLTPADPAWLSPGILSPDQRAPGARYTLHAVLSGGLAPGASAQARFSLRFGDGSGLPPAPAGDPAGPLALVSDVFAAFGRARPQSTPVLARPGPVGALFGSSCGASCHCQSWSPQDCPNPRGWDGSIGPAINTTSAEGVAAFQALARAWVNKSVEFCLRAGLGPGPAACSAIMFWSIEGSQFYQPDPVYIGSPDMLPLLAPEMDAVADELCALVTGAGLRLGFTLRPQRLTQNPGWNASLPPRGEPQRWHQRDFYLPDNSTDVASYAQSLIAKVAYAKGRWGATLFYVDTTVNNNGVLPFEVWDAVARAHPDCIFFPEESEVNYYSATAPLQDDWSSRAIPVNPAVKAIWPAAWSLQLMQFPLNFSVSPFEQWVDLVRGGDQLIVEPWYNSSQAMKVKAIYEAAAAAGPL